MRKRLLWSLSACLIVASTIIFGASAYAESQESNSFRFIESSIDSGGTFESSSDSYNLRSSTGGLTVGETSSEETQIETGPVTTNDPTLSFTIIDASPDIGSFSAGGAAMGTAKFSVKNYTSYGYVVQIAGEPPTNGEHVIDAMEGDGESSTLPSEIGTEQFGINLVANTSPDSVGENPDHGEFGVGSAAPKYEIPNEYRYVSGETIALAPKSSGITIYTISYMVNVEALTPGGKYETDQTLIVTGTY